jgi:hypothetical protein
MMSHTSQVKSIAPTVMAKHLMRIAAMASRFFTVSSDK